MAGQALTGDHGSHDRQDQDQLDQSLDPPREIGPQQPIDRGLGAGRTELAGECRDDECCTN